MIKSSTPGDIVDHDGAGGSTVVGAGDCAEALLAGGVPDLELDLLLGHFDDARAMGRGREIAQKFFNFRKIDKFFRIL